MVTDLYLWALACSTDTLSIKHAKESPTCQGNCLDLKMMNVNQALLTLSSIGVPVVTLTLIPASCMLNWTLKKQVVGQQQLMLLYQLPATGLMLVFQLNRRSIFASLRQLSAGNIWTSKVPTNVATKSGRQVNRW